MKKVLAMVLAVLMLVSLMLVPVSASSSGRIWTDKTQYLEGEMIRHYYEFPATDSNRCVWVFKDTDLVNPVKIFTASGLEGSALSTYWYKKSDEGGTPLRPGNYIMKVTDLDGNPCSPEISTTFKIKSNPRLTRQPSIALDKSVYNLEDTIILSYDGITDALPYNKTVQVTIYDELGIGISEEPIYLFDENNFNGISGTITLDMSEMDFYPGPHYAVIEMEDNYIDYSHTRIDFTVVDPAAATEAPATEAPATNAPATQAPATQAPATQAPATEAPATEAPATEAPATEAPATEAPATEAPATEAPATEAPATEAPEKNSDGGNNTILWVVIGIAGVLLVGAAVVVVILLKKKK